MSSSLMKIQWRVSAPFFVFWFAIALNFQFPDGISLVNF